MIKLVYCVRRRADIPAADFYDYWLNEHGPKVRSVAQEMGAVRYVQSHTGLAEVNAQLQHGRGLADPYDGITEVWFRDAEQMAAAFATPAGQKANAFLAEDEKAFINFAASCVFMTEEHEIFDYRQE